MNNNLTNSSLGQTTQYSSHYDPQLLYPIGRKKSWQEYFDQQPFYGFDVWNAFELSWLTPRGLPQTAVAEFYIPCNSDYIVESKSLKLYLNSFNNTRFNSQHEVHQTIAEDLSKALKTDVEVKIIDPNQACHQLARLTGQCIDHQDISIDHYTPYPDYLQINPAKKVTEQLFSHLLRTNCPVTSQPDWASIMIEYSGNKINHASLLKYLVSFRDHNDFHEQCIENIFIDIMHRCQPQELTIFGRYLRRGGIDINPYRSSNEINRENLRLVRQ